MEQTAVLLMAYGSPVDLEDIEPYYTDIRRGRPPTGDALATLTDRYSAIGGVSPLAEVTEAQRTQLQRELDAAEPGRYLVSLGFKHASPKVEDAARDLAEQGHLQIVGLVLAPHYSARSVGDYLDRLQQGVASSNRDPIVAKIKSWATAPAFIDFLADDLRDRLTAMQTRTERTVRVLFTAHSLPERIIAEGDPYPDELRATAKAVADRLGLREGDDWQVAWQSAGRTSDPWIGPDILTVIDEFGVDDDIGGVIICACGFVADHLEVLYDLDIEAARRAATHSIEFDRSASVNANAAVAKELAALVREAADAASAARS